MSKWLSVLLLFLPIGSYACQISDSATISILTCMPGKQIYSAFGHTAIRVYDPSKIDVVFNYGTFNRKQDNFLWKFLHGDLLYFQSVSSFQSFYQDYFYEGRVVIEQILNLSYVQKQIIWQTLCNDSLPSNRYYKYNFVSNNCTTQIYDILNSINYGITFQSQSRMSFRELINQTIKDEDLRLVLNILMGKDADNTLIGNQRFSLPEVFMSALEVAQNKTEFGFKNLVVQQKTVLKPVLNKTKTNNILFILLYCLIGVQFVFY